MKIILLFVIVIFTMMYLFLSNDNYPKPSYETPGNFRKEINHWTNKANKETNILKSSLYRSYAMANLYFLQPYISSEDYKFLSIQIGDQPDPRVPRYLNPELVLSIVR